MLTTFCGVTSASRALAKPLGYLLLGAFVLALCRQVWRLAGRPVHPDAAGAYLKEKLDFLKAGGLNLYRER